MQTIIKLSWSICVVALVHSGAVLGIDGYPVEVEVNLSQGLPGMSIVGLPDAAVKESSDRVSAAIRNTQLALPVRRITVNLAPADIRKEGSAFDLPIAIGILSASGMIENDRLKKNGDSRRAVPRWQSQTHSRRTLHNRYGT
jgi:magnesium chelatase family protein